MEYQSDQDQVLLSYLLGQSSEQEQERIEEGYFANEDLFEQLRIAEDDLIDSYVRNALSQTQREQFEKHFLCSDDRRKRVEVAEILFEFIARKSVKKAPLPFGKKPAKHTAPANLPGLWMPLAAMLVLLIGGAWALIDRARLKADLNSLSIQRDELERQRTALQQQLSEADRHNAQLTQSDQATDRDQLYKDNRNSPPVSSTRIASFVLISGFSRGGTQSQNIHIASTIELVKLRTSLINDQHNRYRGVINDVDGPEVWQGAAFITPSRRAARTIEVRVPAKVFAEKDYILTLRGVTPSGVEDTIEEYPFSVLRR